MKWCLRCGNKKIEVIMDVHMRCRSCGLEILYDLLNWESKTIHTYYRSRGEWVLIPDGALPIFKEELE